MDNITQLFSYHCLWFLLSHHHTPQTRISYHQWICKEWINLHIHMTHILRQLVQEANTPNMPEASSFAPGSVRHTLFVIAWKSTDNKLNECNNIQPIYNKSFEKIWSQSVSLVSAAYTKIVKPEQNDKHFAYFWMHFLWRKCFHLDYNITSFLTVWTHTQNDPCSNQTANPIVCGSKETPDCHLPYLRVIFMALASQICLTHHSL